MSCAVSRYEPITKQGVFAEDGFAVIRTDSLLIAVRPQAWFGDPADINANFFSLFIKIRNLSKKSISLSNKEISLIVEGNHYDVIPVEKILMIYQSNPLMSQFSQSFSTSEVDVNPEKHQQALLDLLNASFGFGSLVEGGTKSGYVFFKRMNPASSYIYLRIFGADLEFGK